ncbi:MAG: right-handed parallel beta-helix repeat-containing protein [Clostridia bacterium]|nr:right-handed parallel beta-helix repeat-containing protein [Clostridia bacterium]
MNELSELFSKLNSGETLTLECGRIYHVRQDDSFELDGYYCSNTAKPHENPTGKRQSAMYLKDKSDITIDGNGATVLVHGKMTPFVFDRCSDITVKNLTVDYACPTMAEFTVLSNDNGICEIKINSECLYRLEGNDLIWQGEPDKNGKPYWEDHYCKGRRQIRLLDPATGLFRDFSRNDLEFVKIEENGDTLTVELKNKEVYFPAGAVIQSRNIVRDQTGSLLQRCKNLTFDSLRIKFMHGLGMVSQFCDGVSYINCDFTPAKGRTAASTADFFQFSGCKGKLLVKNCKAGGAHDDYINVHGTHLRIVDTDIAKNGLTLRFMHDESWGFQAFEEGDIIDFIKWDTLITYATAKVLSFTRISDTDIYIELDSELPEVEIGKDVVENATWTPDVYVRNCNFGLTCGRGILCTTRGEVIIENNRFENVWGPALLIEDDCNFWFESGYTNEIIFRNNILINCDYAQMYPGAPAIRYSPKVMDESSVQHVHGKLTLEGNSFKKAACGTHLLHLEYLREVEMKDNEFDAPFEINKVCVGNVNIT